MSAPNFAMREYPSKRTTTRHSYSGERRGTPLLGAFLSLYPLALVGVSLAHLLAPQRSGPVALSQVFAPYLFLPLVLLVPFVFVRGVGMLRVALALCLLVFVMRFVPHLTAATLREQPGATYINAMTWNVRDGGVSAEEIRRTVLASGASVVALQEARWEWLDGDQELAAAYPYRLVRPDETAPGLVLLSRYPILEHGAPQPVEGTWVVPRRLWARLDLGDGRTLVAVNVHPFPPNAGPRNRDCAGPLCYETARRDSHIEGIREFIAPLLERGERVLLLGDNNVTDREPAYARLSAGLQDAHKKVGAGLGNTWGIGVLKGVDAPLLRIDYFLSSLNVDPVRMSVDCTYRGSDHCALYGRFGVE